MRRTLTLWYGLQNRPHVDIVHTLARKCQPYLLAKLTFLASYNVPLWELNTFFAYSCLNVFCTRV